MTNKNIEQVFIMAAGRGERMRPLTDATPKPLIKINDTTMLDLIIAKLNQSPSIKKIVVNAYYLSEKIASHIKALNNSKIVVSLETSKLETGGGLLNALHLFDKNKPILVINSDIIWKDHEVSDLKLMMDNFDISQMDILLGLKAKAEFWGYEGNGDFDFNSENGEISKPKNAAIDLNYVFTGIQIINPKIFENPPAPPFSMNYFYQKARNNDGVLEKIKGLELKGDFFHIGTVKAWEDYQKLT
jgi:MurNAc alpha-1-phosphate uridylyltransferase